MPCEFSILPKMCWLPASRRLQALRGRTNGRRKPRNLPCWYCNTRLHSFRRNCQTTCSSLVLAQASAVGLVLLWLEPELADLVWAAQSAVLAWAPEAPQT